MWWQRSSDRAPQSAPRSTARIPATNASADVWSPWAGREVGGAMPGSVMDSVSEPRPKKDVTSKPGRLASGPVTRSR